MVVTLQSIAWARLSVSQPTYFVLFFFMTVLPRNLLNDLVLVGAGFGDIGLSLVEAGAVFHPRLPRGTTCVYYHYYDYFDPICFLIPPIDFMIPNFLKENPQIPEQYGIVEEPPKRIKK